MLTETEFLGLRGETGSWLVTGDSGGG